MTSTQLKNQIDNDITDKVALGSVTTDDVGENMKDVVDYVDQEVKIRIEKTIVTEAQLLDSFTTPIVVLPAGGAGTVRVPVQVLIKRPTGTAYTMAGIAIVNALGASIATISTTIFTANSGVQTVLASQQQINTASSGGDSAYDNQPFSLKTLPSNPTGGTGGCVVFVSYIEYEV